MLEVFGAVRGTVGYRWDYWTAIGSSEALFYYYTDWNHQVIRVACSERVLCANAFRMGCSNTSCTMKYYTCAPSPLLQCHKATRTMIQAVGMLSKQRGAQLPLLFSTVYIRLFSPYRDKATRFMAEDSRLNSLWGEERFLSSTSKDISSFCPRSAKDFFSEYRAHGTWS